MILLQVDDENFSEMGQRLIYGAEISLMVS